TNDQPVIDSITEMGALTEAAGSGVGTTQISATGSMTLSDLDDTDTVTLSEVYNNDMVWSGGTITAGQLSSGQILALVDGFVLDDTGALTVDATSNTVNSSWTYSTAEDLNFLVAGETLVFSYTITVTDDSGVTATATSATKTVTITLTGTNDQPVIDSITEMGALTEAAGSGVGTTQISATGSMTLSDLDDTDTVTLSEVYNNDMVWSGGTITAGQLSSGQILALVDGFVLDDTGALTVDATSNTVNSSWTYSTAEDLNFLVAGETLVFSYTITVTDDSGVTATATSATKTVTIILTGTNDQPAIDSITATGQLVEVDGWGSGTSKLTASGTIVLSDLNDLDTLKLSSVYNADISWSGGDILAYMSAAEIQSMIDGFRLDDVADLPVDPSTNRVTSGWNYSTSEDLNFLSLGETISFSYTVKVTDSQNTFSTDVVTITLVGTNDAPSVVDTSDHDRVLAFGQSYEQSVLGFFTDVDATDQFSYAVKGLPRGVLFDSASGLIWGNANDVGIFTLTVNAYDQQGVMISRQITLTLMAPPDPGSSDPLAGATAPTAGTQTVITEINSSTSESTVLNDYLGLSSTDNMVSQLYIVSDGGVLDVSAIIDASGQASSVSITSAPLSSANLLSGSATNVLDLTSDSLTATGDSGRISAETVIVTETGYDIPINDSGNAALYLGVTDTGLELPIWISINPATGLIHAEPPAGITSFSLKIIAVDTDGNVRTLDILLEFEEEDVLQPNSEVLPTDASLDSSKRGEFASFRQQLLVAAELEDSYGRNIASILVN
ncbi:MAG: hypothetical protein GYB18_03340, partial [Oceanospirillales bacterium]|nr:hypothetical protein [Oceanospirillales bacterium]